jgi:hypothetical protein
MAAPTAVSSTWLSGGMVHGGKSRFPNSASMFPPRQYEEVETLARAHISAVIDARMSENVVAILAEH